MKRRFLTKHYLCKVDDGGILVQRFDDALLTPKEAADELREIADWLTGEQGETKS